MSIELSPFVLQEVLAPDTGRGPSQLFPVLLSLVQSSGVGAFSPLCTVGMLWLRRGHWASRPLCAGEGYRDVELLETSLCCVIRSTGRTYLRWILSAHDTQGHMSPFSFKGEMCASFQIRRRKKTSSLGAISSLQRGCVALPRVGFHREGRGHSSRGRCPEWLPLKSGLSRPMGVEERRVGPSGPKGRIFGFCWPSP